MTLGRWAAGIVLCLWTQLGFAAGSSSPQVALQIDDCAAVAQEDVRRWLQLELGEQVLTLADASSSSSVARVTCEEPGRLSLRIDDPLTGKSIWRSIDLSSQAESVRARLLAVAIAELLYASFAELLLDQRAEVATPKPTQPVAVVKAWSGLLEDKLKQPLPLLGVELGVVASIAVQQDAPTLLAGGGLRLLADTQYHLGWDVDLQYLFARTEGSLGSVRSDRIGGRLAVHGQVRLPKLVIRGGGGLRLGLVRHVGEPLDPAATLGSVQWGPWVEPVLVGSLSVAIARLRLDLALEGGYVAVPVRSRASGLETTSLSGPQLLISLGVGSFLR